MRHQIDIYLTKRLQEKGWLDKELAEKSGISQGQISKLKRGQIEKLSAELFYKIYTAFGDSCRTAMKTVYPTLELKLHPYKPKARNKFGKFMEKLEYNRNTIEEIAVKTGISEYRLKELYYRRAALEAHELLLIEKAVGKKPGEMFEEVFGEE